VGEQLRERIGHCLQHAIDEFALARRLEAQVL
jgi:hypothetical protein